MPFSFAAPGLSGEPGNLPVGCVVWGADARILKAQSIHPPAANLEAKSRFFVRFDGHNEERLHQVLRPISPALAYYPSACPNGECLSASACPAVDTQCSVRHSSELNRLVGIFSWMARWRWIGTG